MAHKTKLVITTQRVVEVDLGDIPARAIAAGIAEHGAFGPFGDYYIGADFGVEMSDEVVRVEANGEVLYDEL